VLLLVPEETVTLRADLRDPKDALENEPAWQPRPNVLYESGIAVTAHPQQTIVLELGRPRRPTDLDGIHAIRIDSKPTWRHEFAERLRTAGCEVDTSGTEWLEVGAFNEPELE
jgi:predicted nucleotide-binding protein